MALDLRPRIHPMPTPPYPYPHQGLVFTGYLVFGLVIDAEGSVLAAFPKSVDGRCHCDLPTLEAHVLNHMSATLLRWRFVAPNGLKPGGQAAVELPILIQEEKAVKI
ncbi:MAG TPA: hypothetical protein VGE76_23940 [Opitutaceae bacterium]